MSCNVAAVPERLGLTGVPRAIGTVRCQGSGPLAGAVARLLRLRLGTTTSVRLDIAPTSTGLTITRTFATRTLKTKVHVAASELIETFGPVAIHFRSVDSAPGSVELESVAVTWRGTRRSLPINCAVRVGTRRDGSTLVTDVDVAIGRGRLADVTYRAELDIVDPQKAEGSR